MIGRGIRDAFKSVIRNFSLSLASISSITITLIVVAVSMMLSANVNNFAKKIESDVTLLVYIDLDTKSDRIEEMKNEIKQIGNVNPDLLKLQTKDEAIKALPDDSLKKIINNWDQNENPLYDTFFVKVKNVDQIDATAKELKTIKNVSMVKYGENIINQLIYVFKVVEKVSIVLVVALILVTAFLIDNTIKLTIFSRKKEIEIMRLVGASNLSINLPFVFEGLFLGMLGSVIPIIATIYGYNALYVYFHGQLFSSILTLTNPIPLIYIVSVIILCIGGIVGMIGSGKAVRKHLKI